MKSILHRNNNVLENVIQICFRKDMVGLVVRLIMVPGIVIEEVLVPFISIRVYKGMVVSRGNNIHSSNRRE